MAHQKADELIRGTYWDDGKGCAIGCTVHSSEHKAYETELGMPEWFARLEDAIFEGMSHKASCRFPMRLLSAIPVGFAEWDRLYHKFCAYILRDVCKFDRTKYPDVAVAVDDIVRLHEQMTESDDQAWLAARSTAESARRAAEESANTAVWSIRSAALAAEESAESAVRSTLVSVVHSAANPATHSVARSATESATLLAAYSAARSAAYDRIANWLILWFNAANRSR